MVKSSLLAFLFLFFLTGPGVASLKIGVVLPLSGKEAPLGRALKGWLEEINFYLARKEGFSFRLRFFDTASRCRSMRRIAEEAFFERLDALIGPVEGSCAQSLLKEARLLGVPAIITSGEFHPVKELKGPLGPYFRTGLSTRASVKVLYRCLKKKGYHQIGLLLTKDAFGRLGEKWLLAYATEYALKIKGKRYFSPSDTDFSVHLEALLSCEAIVCWAPPETCARVAKNAASNRLAIPIFFPSQVAKESFLNQHAGLYGHPFVGAAFLSGQDFPGDEGLKLLFERLLLEGKVSKDPIFAAFADAMLFLKRGAHGRGKRWWQALERAGLVKGLTGLYFLSTDDHYGLLPASVGVFKYRWFRYEPVCRPTANIL